MIPKLIHFVWLGGDMPVLYRESIRVYKRLNPEYTFRLWECPPPDMPPELLRGYEILPYYCQKSDLIRYWVLYKYGGMYFDLDCFPYRSVDDLRVFTAFTAMQRNGFIACAALGAVPYSVQFLAIIEECKKRLADGHSGRISYGPKLLGLPHIRKLFDDEIGSIIAPYTWFYIETKHKRKACLDFAHSDEIGKRLWIERRMRKLVDGVIPFSVHLWGIQGSSNRKV